MAKKLLTTFEKIKDHLEDPNTKGGLQFGTQVVTISDQQGDVATVTFFASVDENGNFYLDYNIAPSAGRPNVKARGD